MHPASGQLLPADRYQGRRPWPTNLLSSTGAAAVPCPALQEADINATLNRAMLNYPLVLPGGDKQTDPLQYCSAQMAKRCSDQFTQ